MLFFLFYSIIRPKQFSVFLIYQFLTGKIGLQKCVTRRPHIKGFTQHKALTETIRHTYFIYSHAGRNIQNTSCQITPNRLLCSIQADRLLLATGRAVIDRWWDYLPVKSQICTIIIIFASLLLEFTKNKTSHSNLIQSSPSIMI